MKKISFIVLFCYSTSLFAQRKTMDFEKYDPVSTLKVPEHIVTKAKFPFIDVHNHQFGMPDANLNSLMAEMDKLNMAVMVNLSGRGRGSAEHLAGAINNVKKHNPRRFIVFTNVDFSDIDDPNWTDRTVKQIEADVKLGANGLKI